MFESWGYLLYQFAHCLCFKALQFWHFCCLGTPLISFRPSCLPFTCDLVGFSLPCPRITYPVMANTIPFIKVYNRSVGRPFILWILKIRLSSVKWHFRSISDIKLETFRYKKALLIFVNTHVPIKIGTKIFWWHFKTPNLDLI